MDDRLFCENAWAKGAPGVRGSVHAQPRDPSRTLGCEVLSCCKLSLVIINYAFLFVKVPLAG